jgi:hypothetical protein
LNRSSAGAAVAANDPRLERGVEVWFAGNLIAERRRLLLVEGSNVTLTVADDAPNDQVTVTVASSGGGGGVIDGTYGDITVSGVGTVWDVAAGVVTTTELGGDITAAGKAILNDANAAAQLATLGAQPLDATLTALAGLATGADKLAYSTGTDTFSQATLTAAGRAILDDATAADQRTTLGAQALDATLTALAGLATGADQMPYSTGVDTFSQVGTTSWGRGLLGAANAEASRVQLELDKVYDDAPIQAVTMLTTYEVLCTKSFKLSAGDTVEIEATGTILNNSAANRTYTFQFAWGGLTLEVVDGAVTTFHATQRTAFRVRAVAAVKSSTSCAAFAETHRSAMTAANTGGSGSSATFRFGWEVSASDITGTQTMELRAKSSAATATQTLTVQTWRIRRMPQRL